MQCFEIIINAGEFDISISSKKFEVKNKKSKLCLTLCREQQPGTGADKSKRVENYLKAELVSKNPKLPYLIEDIKNIIANSPLGPTRSKLLKWKIRSIIFRQTTEDFAKVYCKCGGDLGNNTFPDSEKDNVKEWDDLFNETVTEDDPNSILNNLGDFIVKDTDPPPPTPPQQTIIQNSTLITLANLRGIDAPCHVGHKRDITIKAATAIDEKLFTTAENLKSIIAKTNSDFDSVIPSHSIDKTLYKHDIIKSNDLVCLSPQNINLGLAKSHVGNSTYMNLPSGILEELKPEDKIKGDSKLIEKPKNGITKDSIVINFNNTAYNTELLNVEIYGHGESIKNAQRVIISPPPKIKIDRPSALLRIPIEVNIDGVLKINITNLDLPLVKKAFNVAAKNPSEQDHSCLDIAETNPISVLKPGEKIKLAETKIKLSTIAYIDYFIDTKTSTNIIAPSITSLKESSKITFNSDISSFNNKQMEPLGSLKTPIGLVKFEYNNTAVDVAEKLLSYIRNNESTNPNYCLMGNNLIFSNSDKYWILNEANFINSIYGNDNTYDNIAAFAGVNNIILRYIALIPPQNIKNSAEWNLLVNNKKLNVGEPGYEKDTGVIRIGDGKGPEIPSQPVGKKWSELPVAHVGENSKIFPNQVDIPKGVYDSLGAAYRGISIFFPGTRPVLQYQKKVIYRPVSDIRQVQLQNGNISGFNTVPDPPAGQRASVNGTTNFNLCKYGALSHNRPAFGDPNQTKTDPFNNLTNQITINDYDKNNIFLTLTEQISYNFKNPDKFTISDQSGGNFANIIAQSFDIDKKYKDIIIQTLEKKIKEKISCCCYEYEIGTLKDGSISPTIPSSNIKFELEIEYETKQK